MFFNTKDCEIDVFDSFATNRSWMMKSMDRVDAPDRIQIVHSVENSRDPAEPQRSSHRCTQQ
jgi:hypothetical protein